MRRRKGSVLGLLVIASGFLFLTHPIQKAAGKVVTVISTAISSAPANERLADQLAASYGWTGSQAACLNMLWSRETGGTWDSRITDGIAVAGHNAFGIAQALNHDPGGTHAVSKVTRHYLDGHSDVATVDEYPDTAANAGDARAQIAWGLSYIRNQYGSPCITWTATGHDASGY